MSKLYVLGNCYNFMRLLQNNLMRLSFIQQIQMLH